MKPAKTLCLFSLLLIIFVQSTTLSFAHMIKGDNGFAATFHVDPDDNPEVGKPSVIGVELSSFPTGTQWEKCACQTDVLIDNTVIDTLTMDLDQKNDSMVHMLANYVFTKKGVYSFRFSGTVPTPEGSHTFEMSYFIRVDRGGEKAYAQAMSLSWHRMVPLCCGVLAIGGIAGVYLVKRKAIQK